MSNGKGSKWRQSFNFKDFYSNYDLAFKKKPKKTQKSKTVCAFCGSEEESSKDLTGLEFYTQTCVECGQEYLP